MPTPSFEYQEKRGSVRATDTAEARLRSATGGAVELEPELPAVLVALSAWAAEVAREGLEVVSATPRGRFTVAGRIEGIADRLTAVVAEVRRDLLKKSLQEALFYAVGTDAGLSRTLFAKTLSQTLREENADVLVRGFLVLHVFNVAWRRIEDTFQASSSSHDALVDSMGAVEGLCRRRVNAAWKALRLHSPLDRYSAEDLVQWVADSFRA